MKENKKTKLKRLNFYIIEDDFIDYLSKYDKHIAFNKDKKRPYIGIVIIVNQNYYFAPLFSPKEQHKKYKDNFSFFRIVNKKTKNNLGIIRFSDMIPVPKECVTLLDTKYKKYGYKRLLSEQYSCINIPENREKIYKKSEKLYNIVVNESKSKMSMFYKNLSCNFKLLELKSIEYKKEK